MQDRDAYDIAVVGAGPAGAVAALAGARRGLRVALIDRHTFPRDKTCGDGIGPGAVRTLRGLGLDEILAGRSPVASVTVFGPTGRRSRSPVPVLPGKVSDVFVVPRLEFDHFLFRKAIEAGAADFTGTRCVDTQAQGETRSLAVRTADGAEQTLHARLVVGADGAYSTMRRQLVSEGKPDPKYSGIAMRAYADSREFQGSATSGPSMLFEFNRDLLPSYGWIFPAGPGRINIGVGLPLAELQARGTDLRRLLDGFAEKLRARGVEVGPLSDQRSHHLPGVIGMPRLAHERAVLIGDAASMINPVSGEGIAYSVTAAARLIRALPDRLADRSALQGALAAFEREFRAAHRWHFHSCRLTMELLRHPGSAKAIVRGLQNDPRVLSGMFDMLFGDGRIEAGTALRVARAAIAR